MDIARHTCSICGAEFTEPAEAAVSHCPTCRVHPTHKTSGIAAGHDTAAAIALEATIAAPTIRADAVDEMMATVDAVLVTGPVQLAGHTSEPLRSKFGRFAVISVLGRGAFGTVYRAYDPLLDREVALKVPRFSEDDRLLLERFHREAKSAARLHHPNIVTLYENGQSEDGLYLVSELVDGKTLFEVIRQKQFDMRTAVDWVRQISEALQYAHTEGIVHRDIKPGNIMINAAGRPQVMDFGLAKRDVDEDSNVTVEGQILGTPSYMSPEQARGMMASVGAHSDQYSVGVVLYELLCGCTPFSGSPLVVMSRVGNWKDLPPTPRSIRPEIPRDLEACCLKAIDKDSKLRYPNLQALADDLDHWLKGLPLVARPIGPWEQLARWCQKNQLVATLAGTLTAILLVLAVIGPWLAFRFKHLAAESERDALAAKVAGEKETAARLETERVLVDNYTESGLAADRNGDPRTAVLWFGNAVAAAANHPERERHNRIRMQSWLNQFAIPIQAYPHSASWSKSLNYHPGGQALLSVSNSGEANWIDLATGGQHPLQLPRPITAAAWNADGSQLAVASHHAVAIFEHPSGTELLRWDCPDAVNCLQFTPDNKRLLLGGQKTVHIRELAKQEPKTTSIEIGSRAKVIEVSPDGGRFAIRTDDQQIHVFSASLEQTSSEPLLNPQPAVSEGEIIPHFVTKDRMVLYDSEANEVRCWDLDAKSVVWQYPVKRVLVMTLSPDRKWLAVGDNSDVLLFDVTDGQPFRTRIAHRNLIHGLGFNPQGNLLLTASNDHSVQMFDVPSGRPTCAPIPHNAATHRCVWSPDGSTFATVNWGGHLVRIWKPQQSVSTEVVAPQSADGPFVRLHPAGDRWLSSGFDGVRDRQVLQVVDATSGQAIGSPMTAGGWISDADFIPQSSSVVLTGGGSTDHPAWMFRDQNPDSAGFVRIVDSNSGQPTLPEISTPTQPIAVRVSADGTTAVVLCHRGQILLLETATGKIRATASALEGHEATHGYVIRDRIRISPQGDLFAVWGSREVAEIRDLKTGALRHPLRHSRDFIHDLQFSPDGQTIATCSSDHTVRLWETNTGKAIGSPWYHPGWIFSAQFTQDGKRLLTACDDRHARVWDVATGVPIQATHEQPDQVFGVCPLPGEEFFLVSDRSGCLTAWESRYGKMIAPPRHMERMIYQLTLAGSGTEVIASGRIQPCRSFRWKDWIVEQPLPLSGEELRQLGEILSAQRIHEGGAVISLTSAEWLERWQSFHNHHSVREIIEGNHNH